jgi:hypothetical protein
MRTGWNLMLLSMTLTLCGPMLFSQNVRRLSHMSWAEVSRPKNQAFDGLAKQPGSEAAKVGTYGVGPPPRLLLHAIGQRNKTRPTTLSFCKYTLPGWEAN